MDCDPYTPAPPGTADEIARRSDSLAPDVRGGSLPSAATGCRSSMSSQTSQPPGMILPPKLPHSSLVTLASRLVPESSSPGVGHKISRKEKYLKAKVSIIYINFHDTSLIQKRAGVLR